MVEFRKSTREVETSAGSLDKITKELHPKVVVLDSWNKTREPRRKAAVAAAFLQEDRETCHKAPAVIDGADDVVSSHSTQVKPATIIKQRTTSFSGCQIRREGKQLLQVSYRAVRDG